MLHRIPRRFACAGATLVLFLALAGAGGRSQAADAQPVAARTAQPTATDGPTPPPAPGTIFVADSYNEVVWSVPPGGGIPTIVGYNYADPHVVALDAAGNVFTGGGNDEQGEVSEVPVGHYDDPASFITTIGGPTGIAVDSHENIYATAAGETGFYEAFRIRPDGSDRTPIGKGVLYPLAVAVDRAGNVFIADVKSLVEIYADGRPQRRFHRDLAYSNGLAVDIHDNLYVATDDDQLVEVPADGTDVRTIANVNAYDVAIDGAGNIFATVGIGIEEFPAGGGDPISIPTPTPDDDDLVAEGLAIYLAPQTITFTSRPPHPGRVGETYQATASGGASGNPVVFSASSASSGVCTVTAKGAVTLLVPGLCVVTARQDGSSGYSAATLARQHIRVKPAA